MSEPKKVDRRKFIYAGLGAVALIAIGAAAYVAMNPPVVTQTVTTSTTVPTTSVVTTTVPTTTVVTTTVPTTSTPSEKVEITFMDWTLTEIPFKYTAIKMFEESHPNIKIKPIETPYEGYFDKLVTQHVAGSPPDVFALIPEENWKLAEAGVQYPLDDFIRAEGPKFKEQFVKAAWDMGVWKGQVMNLPWRFGCSCFFLNKKVFRDAGVAIPTKLESWEQIRELAIEIKKNSPPEVYGIGFPGSKTDLGTSWFWYAFLFQNGAELIREDGTVGFNTPEGIESLQFLVDLLRKDKVVPPEVTAYGDNEIKDAFGMGRIAMWHNGPWMIIGILSAHPECEIEVRLMPTRKRDGSPAGGTQYAMSPMCKHKNEAWEFIKFMTSYPIISVMAKDGIYVPPRYDVMEDSYFHIPPISVFIEQAKLPGTHVIGNYPEFMVISDYIQTAQQQAYLGQKTVKEALAWAEEQCNKVLAPHYKK
jgi:ABC-type glycerol-3-phosphate transport system substrate-binding protein